jgi:hypothetical protein
MKNSIFLDLTPCSPLKVNRRFGGTCRLNLQSQRISLARNQLQSRWQAYVLSGRRWPVTEAIKQFLFMSLNLKKMCKTRYQSLQVDAPNWFYECVFLCLASEPDLWLRKIVYHDICIGLWTPEEMLEVEIPTRLTVLQCYLKPFSLSIIIYSYNPPEVGAWFSSSATSWRCPQASRRKKSGGVKERDPAWVLNVWIDIPHFGLALGSGIR